MASSNDMSNHKIDPLSSTTSSTIAFSQDANNTKEYPNRIVIELDNTLGSLDDDDVTLPNMNLPNVSDPNVSQDKAENKSAGGWFSRMKSDIGVEATNRIITNLTEQTARGDLIYSNALYKALQQELVGILSPKVAPLQIDYAKRPFVILVVGVNGVGKTTTIGKLAKRLQHQGKSVMLAAGDTFRAAATEQLQIWGERNGIPVVAQGHGSDSASVIFDAMQSAKAKNIDVLIADTAGRLQNKTNLMAELEKVVRVMKKADDTAPHETMIVLDAGTGQNAINQVQIFNDAVPLTGITITKLDGTAKGGVVFNIANTADIPIRFIGVGESIDDLQAFKPKEFVSALFETDK